MNNPIIKIFYKENYDQNFAAPSYASDGAAGFDIRAMIKELSESKLEILPGKRVLVPTGLIFEIPKGYELQVRPRSGLSLKTGLLIVNSPGTIDSDYRGEVMIIMGNFSDKVETVLHGDRIAQMVLAPTFKATFQRVKSVEELNSTLRGEKGFGHTGMI